MLILGSNHLLGIRLVTNCPPEYGSYRVFATWELSDWVQLPNHADTFSEYFLTIISPLSIKRVPMPLECKRQTLYEEEKPSKEFLE
jgi:hypothetical protein